MSEDNREFGTVPRDQLIAEIKRLRALLEAAQERRSRDLDAIASDPELFAAHIGRAGEVNVFECVRAELGGLPRNLDEICAEIRRLKELERSSQTSVVRRPAGGGVRTESEVAEEAASIVGAVRDEYTSGGPTARALDRAIEGIVKRWKLA